MRGSTVALILCAAQPNTQSREKIDLLRALGAEVRPVPAVPFTDPANYNHQAKEFAESLDNGKTQCHVAPCCCCLSTPSCIAASAIWTDQFDNRANRRAHVETTGPEIWDQTRGEVDGFTCATGTGGTLSGVSEALKMRNEDIRIYLADPPGSVLHSWVSSGGTKMERAGSSITEGA